MAVLKWDKVRYDPGQNYDIRTGAYTVPYDGFYSFSVQKADVNYGGQFMILLDGAWLNYAWNYYPDTGDDMSFLNIHIKLNAGQKVQVANYRATTVYGTYGPSTGWNNGQLTRSYFSGTMLYPVNQ